MGKLTGAKIVLYLFFGLLGGIGAMGTSIMTEWVSCNLKQNGYLCGIDCNDKGK